MKRSKLIKPFIALASLLVVCSCTSKEENSVSQVSSNAEQSSGVFVDPNVVSLPSVYSLEQKLNSKLSVTLEYELNNTRNEIQFTRYGEYTKYEDSGSESDNCFVKNDSGRGLFYEKDESGRYTSFVCDDFDQHQYYRKSYVGYFGGVEYVFKSNQEISYLGRSCIKYTNKEEADDSMQDSLIIDKETGLVLHYDLKELTQNSNKGTLQTDFKFNVKEIRFGEEAKNTINENIENVYAEPLSSTTLEALGFQGELETPNFAISDCSTKWQGESLNEYKIEYKDRVNSGNDTYINQFETFTTCLYNMGFKKPSSQASDGNYQALVVDSTFDYDADISFAAFATKNSNTYKAESHLTVKGGQASITFTLNHVA